MAMEMKAGIEADLGVIVPITAFLEPTSLAGLAEVAPGGERRPLHRHATLVPVGDDAEHVPSYGQQSLWYAHQLSSTPGAYNIAGAARVGSALDAAALRRSPPPPLVGPSPAGCGRLFPRRRRPADRPGPRRAGAPTRHRAVDASGWNDAELDRLRDEEAARPFDLEAGPLVRVRLWRRSARDHVALLVLHHIIADFWTTTVLMDEFGRIYAAETAAGPELEPPSLQFTDFVRWQAEMLAGPEGRRLWSHSESLGSPPPPPALDLPTDRPRPAIRSEGGAVRHLELDEGLTGAILRLAGSSDASLSTRPPRGVPGPARPAGRPGGRGGRLARLGADPPRAGRDRRLPGQPPPDPDRPLGRPDVRRARGPRPPRRPRRVGTPGLPIPADGERRLEVARPEPDAGLPGDVHLPEGPAPRGAGRPRRLRALRAGLPDRTRRPARRDRCRRGPLAIALRPDPDDGPRRGRPDRDVAGIQHRPLRPRDRRPPPRPLPDPARRGRGRPVPPAVRITDAHRRRTSASAGRMGLGAGRGSASRGGLHPRALRGPGPSRVRPRPRRSSTATFG